MQVDVIGTFNYTYNNDIKYDYSSWTDEETK